MADKTHQVQPLGKRFWNAVFGRSPAPGSGADRSIQGEAPIRISSNHVQKKRLIGNDTFRVPGPHRPRVPYDRALIVRAGKLDQNFETGRIWFAEELNRESGIFVRAEGGYRLVDYDEQGKEIASQDVSTALLGHPQDDKDQGPRTLKSLRLVSVKADQLPKYHFWKRDDEVEPVGRIIEQPRAPIEPPRKRDDRPKWKITADAVDHAFAMDRCRTFKPPEFEERGERIPNFNIAANPEHHEKFRVKRKEMLRLFEGQKRNLYDIVNDTFDSAQKQLLLPALYVNAVHERQEQDKVKYAEAMGEKGAYRNYRDNAITKMAMLWFGQPIAPLRYMEVIHDYTKNPDAIPEPEPNFPRFERITEPEAPLEFLDMFDERSYGYPMLRLKRPSPEQLERRAQLLKDPKTSSFAGSGETTKQSSDGASSHPAGRPQSKELPKSGSIPPKPLENAALEGGGSQSVRGGGRIRGVGRRQGPSGGTPIVAGPAASTITDRGSKAEILTKSAPAVSQPAPVKLGATLQQLSGSYVPSLRGGEQSDDEMSEVLAYYEVDDGQSSQTRRLQNEDRTESTQISSSQASSSQRRSTRARSAHVQTVQAQTIGQQKTGTKATLVLSGRNQDAEKQKGHNQSGRTHGVETPITQDAQITKSQETAVQIWGPKMEVIFRMTWPEIRQRKDFVQMVMKHMSRRIKNIDGIRFVMDTKYPKPSRVFTALDVLADTDVPDIMQRPKLLWVIPYWNTIEISDVTPSQDPANPDQSTRPGVTIKWSYEKSITSLRECLKELYGKDWDDREEVIVNYLNQDNVPGQLVLTDFTYESDFWFMMNDLVNPELFVKRPGALDPMYRPSKPAPISRTQIEGITRAPVGPAPSTNAPGHMEGVESTQANLKTNPTSQSTTPSDDTFTTTTSGKQGLKTALPYQETLLRRSLGLEEPEKPVHPNLARYVDPRSKKRSRTEWEEWVLDQEKKDRKKHDEYTMERSIYSYDDPPLIPTSGRPVQQGITGGSSVATVYVRNVTATDQARLQRQRRKLENIYLDRVQACPVCPAEFLPGPGHTHEVEAHWQWHRDRLMEDKACPICGDKEWVSFNLDLKRHHLRDHIRLDLETCPAVDCNVNLRDPDAFPTIIEAAQHILGHKAPPETDTFSRLGKQQAILRRAINLIGVPTLRDALCKWVMPNGVWCGEDLNDTTKYSDWQDVCDHLFSHYTPKTSKTTQSGNGYQVTNANAADPHDKYVCRMIVENEQCTYMTHNFGNFYQHVNATHRAPLSCPMCQAQATGEMNLIFHMDKAHPPQLNEHPCPAGSEGASPCGRKFSSDQLLFEHVIAEHSTERPPIIKCQRGNGCLFQTQDSVAFDEHLRAHEGRALRCGECNYVSHNGENLDALREHLIGHATAKIAAGINKINKPMVLTGKTTRPSKMPDSEPKGSGAVIVKRPTANPEVEGNDEDDLVLDDTSTRPNPVTPHNARLQSVHIELDDDDFGPIDLNEDGTRYQHKEPVYLWCNKCWMKAASESHTKRHVRSCGLKPEEREEKTTFFAGLLRAQVDKNYTSPRPPKDFFVPEDTPSQSTDSDAGS